VDQQTFMMIAAALLGAFIIIWLLGQRRVRRGLRYCAALFRDPETPWSARLMLGAALAYFAMPFGIVPDSVPVLSQMDDLIFVPLLLWAGLKLVPPAARRKHAHLLTPPPE